MTISLFLFYILAFVATAAAVMVVAARNLELDAPYR